MANPEGRVKDKVRRLLRHYVGMYTYWPVPSGYGATTLDVIGCYRGQFFAIETKAKGKKPTLRQTQVLASMDAAMGKTFVIIGEDSTEFLALDSWLTKVTRDIPYDPHLTPDTVQRRKI